jgi:hypothetical protein
LTAAELLCEGGLELLVREPASAGADLTVDSEGARGYLAHDLRRDEAQIAGDCGRVRVDRVLVGDDRRQRALGLLPAELVADPVVVRVGLAHLGRRDRILRFVPTRHTVIDIVRFQLLAIDLAEARGVDPDMIRLDDPRWKRARDSYV